MQVKIINLNTESADTVRGKNHVYFLKDQNLVKIGYTGNLLSRLSNYKTHNPRQLHIIGLCEGSVNEEKYLHNKFKELRVENSEWFQYKSQIDDYLGENKINLSLDQIYDFLSPKLEIEKYNHQVNTKLGDKDIEAIKNINDIFYDGQFTTPALIRILIRKGIGSYKL